MTKVLRILLFAVAFTLLCAVPSTAQYSTITATKIKDASGAPLASGEFCISLKNAFGQTGNILLPGGGQAISSPVCRDVTAGVIMTTYKTVTLGALAFADASLTNPTYQCGKVVVTNNADGSVVLGSFGAFKSAYDCVQPTGSTWSFDSFIPPGVPGVAVVAGPVGPAGPAGPTGPAGSGGSSPGGNPGDIQINLGGSLSGVTLGPTMDYTSGSLLDAGGGVSTNPGGYQAFGDSIAYGTGTAATPPYPLGYVAQINSDINSAGNPYNNRAIGGDDAADMSFRVFMLANPTDTGNPVTTLSIGTNDSDLACGAQPLTAWSSSTTYAKYVTASYSGASYVSLGGSNLNQEPDISPTYWTSYTTTSLAACPGGVLAANYLTSFWQNMWAVTTWLTQSSTNKVLAQSSSFAQAGTWATDATFADAPGLITTTNASSLTDSTAWVGQDGVMDFWYYLFNASAGSFQVKVDGTARTDTITGSSTLSSQNGGVTPRNAGPVSVAGARFAGLTPGMHTVSAVVTSATAADAWVGIIGAGFPPVLRARGVTAPSVFMGGMIPNGAGWTAFNTATIGVEKQVVADGGNAIYVDLLYTAMDPNTDFLAAPAQGCDKSYALPHHPDICGARHIANAFEHAMGNPVSGSGSGGAMSVPLQVGAPAPTSVGVGNSTFNSANLSDGSAINPGATFYCNATNFNCWGMGGLFNMANTTLPSHANFAMMSYAPANYPIQVNCGYTNTSLPTAQTGFTCYLEFDAGSSPIVFLPLAAATSVSNKGSTLATFRGAGWAGTSPGAQENWTVGVVFDAGGTAANSGLVIQNAQHATTGANGFVKFANASGFGWYFTNVNTGYNAHLDNSLLTAERYFKLPDAGTSGSPVTLAYTGQLITAYGGVVSLFGGGSCSGFLKSDGSCTAGAPSNPSGSGTNVMTTNLTSSTVNGTPLCTDGAGNAQTSGCPAAGTYGGGASGFWGGTGVGGLPPSTNAGVAISSSANAVKVLQFYLPIGGVVSKATIDVTTLGTSAVVDIALLDSTKTLVLHTGAVSGAAVAVLTTSTLNSSGATASVTLAPGTYYLAYTTSVTTVQLAGIATALAASIINSSSNKMGTCTATATAGVMANSFTCGTITAGSANWPLVYFE
jgi:hypothetical protein